VQLLCRHFCAKKVQTLNLNTKKLRAKLSYKKAARIMLVKLTPDLLTTPLTLTAKQSENGMVMKTRTIEKKVRRWAQIPGPSSHAEKETNYILRIFFLKKNK
jgi:hypothetical protein